jgi:phage baseplate assembly protein W
MPNYAPRIPLTIDKIDGAYSMIKDLKLVAQQNLKMLLLTEPGERIMLPNYGVGLKRNLFQNIDENLFFTIENKIRQKVSNTLPYISITEVLFNQIDQYNNFSENAVQIKIYYNILPIKESDLLTIEL